MPAPFRDLTGQKFNHLTALRFEGFKTYSTERKRVWRWRCDCGNEIVTPAMYVTGGGTKSCGCIIGKHKKTHDATDTLEFKCWGSMRQRCQNKNHPSYPDYGGRGISVCERWEKFENFLFDMGPKPIGSSIDRINNEGNYEPSNCRWTTRVEQSNNRRSSLVLEHNGKRMTAAKWERELGLRPGTVHRRLKRGLPLSEVLRGIERVSALSL